MCTKLDRLNKLLRNPSLKLPDFRSHVDRSGANLKWLRKIINSNSAASEELKNLLTQDIHSLLEELEIA